MREFENIKRLSGLILASFAFACGPVEQFHPLATPNGQGQITVEDNGFSLTASCAKEHKLGNIEFGPHIDLEFTTPGIHEEIWAYIENPSLSKKSVAVFLKPNQTIIRHGFIDYIIFKPGKKYRVGVYGYEAKIEKQVGRLDFGLDCPP